MLISRYTTGFKYKIIIYTNNGNLVILQLRNQTQLENKHLFLHRLLPCHDEEVDGTRQSQISDGHHINFIKLPLIRRIIMFIGHNSILNNDTDILNIYYEIKVYSTTFNTL